MHSLHFCQVSFGPKKILSVNPILPLRNCMNHAYPLSELCRLFNGIPSLKNSDLHLSSFSIDSRKIVPGGMFFCITGERTDGHLYVEKALENGASCVIAQQSKLTPQQLDLQVPFIFVDDPNLALRQLASDYRNRFQGQTVLGITGSNGKTSTKEIAAELARLLGKAVHATRGNFNNFIGVPLTLLAAQLDELWWVIEMGTNQFGEISTLSQMVRPHLGIITSIGESHLEFLGNTEGVAKEKSGLFDGLETEGYCAIPCTIKHREVLCKAASEKSVHLINYGFEHWEGVALVEHPATITERNLHQTRFQWQGHLFSVNQSNPVMLGNLLGVLSIFQQQGVSLSALQDAVARLEFQIKGRMAFHEMSDYVLVDDTYNANPSSFEAVVEGLRSLYPQRRLVVVAGAMAELGTESPRLHQNLGMFFRKSQVHRLMSFGAGAEAYGKGWSLMEGGGTEHFTSMDALLVAFQLEKQAGDVILVKGSRSAQMERFVQNLLENNQA